MRRAPLNRGGAALVAAVLALGAVLGLTAAAPGVAFTASTSYPAAGSLVLFADASSGSPTAWSWDFGDGGTSTERNPAHAFAVPGAFTVRLTVSSASGPASASLPVTVTPAEVLRLNAAHSFDVTLTARDQRTGATGSGVVIGQNDVYGYFSLPSLSGNSGNPELIVKMVDASGIGQGYWVFYGTMTDLDFTLSVKENATGVVKTYAQDPAHPSGQFDTTGFAPTPGPTATPTPPAGVQTITIDTKAWEFSPGGLFAAPLVVKVGTAYRLRFHNVDPAGTTLPNHGFSGISDIGISASPGNTISPGRDYTTEVFIPQPFHRGGHPFSCTNNDCGGDPQQHTFMLGTLIVQ
ncbi:MAG: PKD domain-containing protein [Acidobacteriota bacterium]|nr:PKD domain-containing protein [Acidobacteriota bacterium]